jgi:spermidine/putrescine transport system permease protein
MLVRMQLRAKSLIYAVLVSPILAPGIVLGISTFIFWSQQMGLRASWWTAALAQSSFISAYCMLIFMARLQRFDTTLEEAGLDLGANPRQVFWRITVPYLRPAFLSAAALAFLQSFENYTTTYFSIGAGSTFTIFIANKVRQGVTPAVNAVAFIIVATTIVIAIVFEVRRRRRERRTAEAARQAQAADVAMAAGLAQVQPQSA